MLKFRALARDQLWRLGWRLQRAEVVALEDEPIELNSADRQIIADVLPYTMTTKKRLAALVLAVKYVVEAGIPGDFVECGVWRGGSSMAIALKLIDLGCTDRRIWLYDTFSGMTEPELSDVNFRGNSATDKMSQPEYVDLLSASLDAVKSNMRSTSYPEEFMRFVVGDVEATLDTQPGPSDIALLRLDTDWEASTAAELRVLYPRVRRGGVCIVDDYGHWSGSRAAVESYFAQHPPRPFMSTIDYSARSFVVVG